MTTVFATHSAVESLPVGKHLTVTAPSGGAGFVQRVFEEAILDETSVGSSSSQTFGPYPVAMQFRIGCTAVSVSFSQAAATDAADVGGGGDGLSVDLVPNGVVVADDAGTALRCEAARILTREPVTWMDFDNYEPSTGSIDVSGYPFAPTVNDSFICYNPNSPQDAGIWVMTAIDGDTATVTRRSDSLPDAKFVTGETVYVRRMYTTYVLSVIDASWNPVSSGTISADGSGIMFQPNTATYLSNSVAGSGQNAGGLLLSVTPSSANEVNYKATLIELLQTLPGYSATPGLTLKTNVSGGLIWG